MKKTFNVDDNLIREAKAACGAITDTETIRLGLEALVRHAAYERLRGASWIRASGSGRAQTSREAVAETQGGLMVLVDASLWIRFLPSRALAGAS